MEYGYIVSGIYQTESKMNGMEIVEETLLTKLKSPGEIRSAAVPMGFHASPLSERVDSLPDSVGKAIAGDLPLLSSAVSSGDGALVSEYSLGIMSLVPFSPVPDYDGEFLSLLREASRSGAGGEDVDFCLGLMHACGFGTPRDIPKAHGYLCGTARGTELARMYRVFDYCGDHSESDNISDYVQAAMALCGAADAMDSGEWGADEVCGFAESYSDCGDIHLRNAVMAAVCSISRRNHIRGVEKRICEMTGDGYLRYLLDGTLGRDDPRCALVAASSSVSPVTLRETASDVLGNLDFAGEAVLNLGRSLYGRSGRPEQLARCARYAAASADTLCRHSFIIR